MTTFLEKESEEPIDRFRLSKLVMDTLMESERDLTSLAIVSADYSRKPRTSGEITEDLFLSRDPSIDVGGVFLALGSHAMHTHEQNRSMFGAVPDDIILGHDWEDGTITLGSVPEDMVRGFSGGEECKWATEIPIQINRNFYEGLREGNYSAAVSIGRVMPHVIVGFSNGLKNILVGLGGRGFIDTSHFLGATYGSERIMGRLDTPVRKLLNYAHELYLQELGIVYVMTVLDKQQNVRGIYIGDDIETHAKAAALSRKLNVETVDAPLDHVVVYLDPEHYKELWQCNNAIYKTRMALADGAELVVIAPGLESYVNNPTRAELVGKYGFIGADRVLDALEHDAELAENLAVAGHLIHGSTEGRFNVTYATNQMSTAQIEDVGFNHRIVRETKDKYHFSSLKPGFNEFDRVGKFFYVPDPNILLSTQDRLQT